MLSNVRRSASRSPWLSRGANPAAIISNSGEFLSGGNVANTPITASSVIIAAPSSPCRICAPAWSNSARTRAATAAATARPAFPGANPTSSASPVRNVVGGPIIPVELRRAAASSANSTPALNIPARADSGLTLSATDAPAAAHASRKSARSASV